MAGEDKKSFVNSISPFDFKNESWKARNGELGVFSAWPQSKEPVAPAPSADNQNKVDPQIDNVATETEPVNPFHQRVSKLERPDLSSVLSEYDKMNEELRNERDAAKKNKTAGILTDIGLLIGDYISAKGNTVVNRRNPGATGLYNAEIQRLDDLYKRHSSQRPDLLNKILLQNYQNDIQQSNDEANWRDKEGKFTIALEREKREKEKADHAKKLADDKFIFDKAYKEAILEGKDKDLAIREAKLEVEKFNAKSLDDYRKKMSGVASQNAYTNRRKVDLTEEKQRNQGNKAPVGSTNYYDPNTGTFYQISEKTWKANYPTILHKIAPELEKDPNYRLLKMKGMSPSEEESYVKKIMYDHPNAVKHLGAISDVVMQTEPLGIEDEDDTYLRK